MESLIFLLVMVGLIVVGTAVVLLRAREPKGEYRGIKTFQREMRALAPDGSRTVDMGVRTAALDPLLPDATTVVPSGDELDAPPPDQE
jgi:hypothetical protein